MFGHFFNILHKKVKTCIIRRCHRGPLVLKRLSQVWNYYIKCVCRKFHEFVGKWQNINTLEIIKRNFVKVCEHFKVSCNPLNIIIGSGSSSWLILTLSWRRSLSYRNQSIDLQSKSMNWFLYDRDLRHERSNKYTWQKYQQYPKLLQSFYISKWTI